jgi:hypothetical protein
VRKSIDEAAPDMAHALLLGDESEGRDAALQVVETVWRDQLPPAWWWWSELGRACARRLADTPYGDRAVSPKEASFVLGFNKARIYQLLQDGQLQRDGDGGGIRLSSLLTHIATRTPKKGWRPPGPGSS